jgi:hypothetical protein
MWMQVVGEGTQRLPNTRAVSVKIDESRHEAAKDWLEWIIRWKVDEKGNEKKPELMNLPFLDDSLEQSKSGISRV